MRSSVLFIAKGARVEIMTKQCSRKRQVFALAFMVALLMEAEIPAFASDGKKHFKEGIQLAENKQWDKAAERLALALAEEPANAEYQLHLQRALVNAAIMLVERGDRLAAQKDYNAAYHAYRQACAFDVTNEVAAMKMRRMLEAQGISVSGPPVAANPEKTARDAPGRPVSLVNGKDAVNTSGSQARGRQTTAPPPRKTDVIIHNGNLLGVIEQ